MGESEGKFVFSREINAHKSDVKSIAVNDKMLITSSRDSSIKIFCERNANYSETLTIYSNDKLAVNSVAFHLLPDHSWVIFSGRKDGTIAVHMAGQAGPVSVLHGHQLNVCALSVSKENNQLLSSSWDGTAIVWDIDKIVREETEPMIGILYGHKMSVWAVAAIPYQKNVFLTGSADQTIKLWKDTKELKTFTGHKDVVRCIVILSLKNFLSASNDGTIRMWDTENDTCLQSYCSSTDSFIYSMCVHRVDTDLFVINSGENGMIECWKLENLSLTYDQLISTPSQSLWCLASISNGDFAVATDSGKIYIFTKDAARKASDDTLEVFNAETTRKLAALQEALDAQKNKIVTIKVAMESGPHNMELKYKLGSDPSEAAKEFIRENNLSLSYLDEITEFIKTKIPEARDFDRPAATSQINRKVTVDGKEWDHALKVTTDDGRDLKLCYNVGEGHNLISERFIKENNLPVAFGPEICALLKSTTNKANIGNGSSYYDPFTGSERYIPTDQPDQSKFTTTVSPIDSNAISDAQRPRNQYLPLQSFITFGIEQKSSRAIDKLREMNAFQTKFALTEDELKAVEQILTETNFVVSDLHTSALDKGLKWDTAALVPILDAFRISLLIEPINRHFCSVENNISSKIHEMLIDSMVGSQSDPVRILVARALANCATHQWGRKLLQLNIELITSALISVISGEKESLQVAASSALCNLSLILLNSTELDKVTELGPREDILRAIVQGLESIDFEKFYESTKFRLLQAIGTLMWGDTTVIKLAKTRDVAYIIKRLNISCQSSVIESIGKNIMEMMDSVQF